MKYKICPSCNTKNPDEELMCINCMADLSNAQIVEEPEDTDHIPNKTRVEIKRDKLILKHYNRFSIEVFPGDIVGRHAKGSEYLKEYPTVSRRHAKFYKEANDWYVEDLNSTNGTYLNGKRINANAKEKIKHGDVIYLSSSVSFKVFLEN